ncbi:8548_t:CDS:1, partial [Diversispora eburnea]
DYKSNPTVAVLKIGSSSYEWSIPSSDENLIHPYMVIRQRYT